MTTYYISYGEPGSGFNWRIVLLILLGLLALSILAGIAYGIFTLVTGEDDGPGVAAADNAESIPLAGSVMPLYGDNTNTIFLVDTSKSIEDGGNLPAVREALLAVALPYLEDPGSAPRNSRAALVPFTEIPELPQPTSLDLEESPEAVRLWFSQVEDLATTDRAAYIYDAVAAAHQELHDLNDDSRDNAIVLLTDGGDGGFSVVYPSKLALCPPGVADEAGTVCSPVLQTIAIDINKLAPCPQNMAAAPGEVCNPVEIASAGENITAYHPIDPNELRVCPPELGGETNYCGDITVSYLPVNPAEVQACPAGFDHPPGSACIESNSEISRDELLAKLVNSDVAVKVHTIGLGAAADHVSLKLLAEATDGQYIYAER